MPTLPLYLRHPCPLLQDPPPPSPLQPRPSDRKPRVPLLGGRVPKLAKPRHNPRQCRNPADGLQQHGVRQPAQAPYAACRGDNLPADAAGQLHHSGVCDTELCVAGQAAALYALQVKGLCGRSGGRAGLRPCGRGVRAWFGSASVQWLGTLPGVSGVIGTHSQ